MSTHETQLRRALEAIQKLRARLDAVENASREPVAVIGIGCRFPGGANGPDDFWRLLETGVDVSTDIPADRWNVESFFDPNPDTPGKMYTRSGAFLSNADSFDAPFFGIAPREASAMDPQQRLLLEVAWEALEHAGQAPSRLAGADAGVFIGISTNDYSQLLAAEVDPHQIDAYAGTGTAFNVAAGRIAYFLGLHGPCMAVDTACSSSLVAIHLACQNLRARKCRMALAGGVNLILSPISTVYFCQMHALARDGRCKAFDSSADGYGRGEGCGVIVLKRLSDAVADGDRILAMIRGSAVNHDGRSSGLTVPNGPAQQSVIREALADAGIEARDISLIEAHGTGTPLGDPIEMRALAAALGGGRAGTDAITVGSVKTNLGHLEAAAGVAGLIKLVLSLQHRQIPPHLHFREPNPHIPWSELPVKIPTALEAWNPAGGRRIAGVSSFGFSGTNAHVIVEEAPAVAAPVGSADGRPHVLCVSARSDAALRTLAAAYVQHPIAEDSFADLCATANTGRSHFLHRLAIVTDTSRRAQETLASFVNGEVSDGACHGSRKGPREIAFLFTGQGSQYTGMARVLYQTQPVFRRTLDECDALLRLHMERPLLSVLFPAPGSSSPIDQTEYTQPSLFALEYSLAAMWRSWGVEPSMVLGHSVGEYVAACVAGMFPLEAGLALIAERARLMQSLPAGGAMAAVAAGERRAAEAIAPWRDRLAIAAVNGPEATVISGEAGALDQALETLSLAGISAQKLTVSHAFHSALMDPMLDSLVAAAQKAPHRMPALPLISNVTGELLRFNSGDMPEYWRRHARMPVRFLDSVRTARSMGTELFLEIGPAPVLSTLGRKCIAQNDAAVWLPTLRRGDDDWKTVLSSLARVYAEGVDVDWAEFERGNARRKVSLPTYPFERKRYWFDRSSRLRSREETHDDGLYEIAWEPRALEIAPEKAPGTWLVLGAGKAGDAVSQALQPRVDRVIGKSSGEDLDLSCAGIVFVCDREGGVEASTNQCDAVLRIAQALAKSAEAGKPRLWVVTRKAQPAGPEPRGISVKDSPLWGLARGISLEHPEIWGGIVDVDDGELDNPARLIDEILSSSDDDQVALRSGARYVARLNRIAHGAQSSGIRFRDDATYLITGGAGGLGMRLARWMVKSGAKHLVLTGRTPRVLSELGNLDATVQYVQADVTDRAAMELLFDALRSGPLPLRGIVHAAGVSLSRSLVDLDSATVRSVLSPKVDGAWILHELSAGANLDFFLLFSSIASVWGSKGLAHYAAGNAFLDALAWHRNELGLPALSINWGPWTGEGMASGDAGAWLGRIGVNALAEENALQHLSNALQSARPQVTVADVDWSRFVPVYEVRRSRPFLEKMGRGPGEFPHDAPALPKLLKDAHGGQRLAMLIEHLRSQVGRTLGFDASAAIAVDQGFFEMGMDSLTAVELRNRLEADLGKPLRATLAMDFPNIKALAGHLLKDVLELESNSDVAAVSAGGTFEGDPAAIIGIGCRFPGSANDPDSFWRLLRDGVDAMSEVPAARWNLDRVYDPDPDAVGKMYTRYGAFIDEVDGFDASFFGISPREAMSMDPQQRLLLEVAWEALENAGQSPESLVGSSTGVFIGISGNDYAHLVAGGDPLKVDAYFGSGNSLSAAAGRISFALGLQGPSMALDTACSSSLAALHLACRSLQAGESRLAIVGGVNLMLTPSTYVNLSRARMLAPDGRCKTFDAAANGYARGEGCGVVVLKRLSEALHDGDRVLAVVRGSAVNQDGHSGGFTVPNGPSQEAVIRAALAVAGTEPRRVSYVEAHGTGTPLGDPIEVQALAAVLGKDREPANPLVIGSVKTNIGHLEAASGMAGLIKVVLALVHEEIPRHLHFTEPNPYVPWDTIPVRVADQPLAWRAVFGEPRLAGVSSFGFVGTNAHVVLEEAPQEAPQKAPQKAPQQIRSTDVSSHRPLHILPLSARSDAALQNIVALYRKHLDRNPQMSLPDLCHTAAAGRSHFEHRVAVVIGSTEDEKLRRLLSHFARGEAAQGLYRSETERGTPPRVAFLFGDEVGQDASVNLFALQCRLAEQWRSWGIEPAVVIGNGAGKYAAACVAGMFGPDDAQALLRERANFHVDLDRKPRIPLIIDLDAETPAYDVCVKIGATDWATLLDTLARLYVAGAAVNWAAFDREYPRRKIELPTYPFEHKRYWPELPSPPVAADEGVQRYRLLGRKIALPFSREVRFENRLTRHSPAYLEDHRLFGTVVVPGASHVAMAIAAAAEAFGSGSCTIEDLVFPQALVLGDDENRKVQFIIAQDTDSHPFQLVSQTGSNDESWNVHASGRIRTGGALGGQQQVERVDEIQARCSERSDGASFYQAFAEMGYTLGPRFRWIGPIWRRAGEALCRLDSPGNVETGAFHPGLIDSCFQLLSCCHEGELADMSSGDSIYIPFTIAEVRIHRADAVPAWCHAVLRHGTRPAEQKRVGNLRLLDRDGNVVADVIGFESRRVSRQALSASAAKLSAYSIRWQDHAFEPIPLPRGRWLIAGDSDSLAASLAALLRASGNECDRAMQDLDCQGIVFIAADPAQPLAWQTLLSILQNLAVRKNPPPVWIVTRGALADPAHAPLWGLTRTAAIEHASLRCTTIDLDPKLDSAAQARDLFQALSSEREEHEIALCDGRQRVPRLLPLPEKGDKGSDPSSPNFTLEIAQRGVLENFVLRPSPRVVAGPGQVELRVRTTGLNFRDVLAALDLYPGVIPFGGECAGTVVNVGAGVNEFRPGDAVAAFAPDSFGAYVTVPEDFAALLPKSMSFEDAATIPAAFLTAYYGLHRLAGLKRGDRILIHAAAGGVGMAAVKIAMLAGAEIFATAGNSEKRERLRSLGVQHVFDSRSLEFAGEIRSIVKDRGIDVVLNSLSGEFIPQSLSLLGCGGRFLEIGKRGIWPQEEMHRIRPDVAYFPYDLEKAGRENPALLRAMFRDIMAQMDDGRLTPLPRRVFGLDEVGDAFRFMAQARHIGKVVVKQPEPEMDGPLFAADATYLVTGGTGGIGLRLAHWMVERGARHIVLTARREPAVETQAAISELRKRADILVAQADVSKLDDMSVLLDRIDATLPTLRGVFHAAGVIDDAVLLEQTPDRFRNVFAAKVDGASILHKLTRTRRLDHFVLFSSMASAFGSPGQANYSAANAYLDALAHQRRSEGLAGLSVNWGPWREGGMAARMSGSHQARWKAQGIGTLEADQALSLLESLMRGAPAQVVAVSMDWGVFMRHFPAGHEPRLFQELRVARAATRETEAKAVSGELRDLIERTPAAKRHAVLSEHIRAKASEVLGLKADKTLPPRRPLSEMGLDSLMAVELRNAIALALGTPLPATLIFDFPTIESLTEYVETEVLHTKEARADHVDGEAIVEELSADDLDEIVSSLSDAGGRSHNE